MDGRLAAATQVSPIEPATRSSGHEGPQLGPFNLRPGGEFKFSASRQDEDVCAFVVPVTSLRAAGSERPGKGLAPVDLSYQWPICVPVAFWEPSRGEPSARQPILNGVRPRNGLAAAREAPARNLFRRPSCRSPSARTMELGGRPCNRFGAGCAGRPGRSSGQPLEASSAGESKWRQTVTGGERVVRDKVSSPLGQSASSASSASSAGHRMARARAAKQVAILVGDSRLAEQKSISLDDRGPLGDGLSGPKRAGRRQRRRRRRRSSFG